MQIPASVIHEQFENEVVVVNMETGHYFSLAGAAGQLWRTLVDGGDAEALLAKLIELQGGQERQCVEELDAFLALLRAEGLLQQADTPSPLPAADVAAYLEGTRLSGSVEKFTDVEGLLLLDPIHEVDEAGWPRQNGKA